MEALIAILFVIFGFLIWLYPIVKIGISKRTSGGEKLAWLLVTIFIFWLAWIFYLLLAPLKKSE